MLVCRFHVLLKSLGQQVCNPVTLTGIKLAAACCFHWLKEATAEGHDLSSKELFCFGGQVDLQELQISSTGDLRFDQRVLLKKQLF